VVCGSAVDENVKNDIATAGRLNITATTLDGILTVQAQERMKTRNSKTHTSENYGKWIISSGGSPDGKRFPCNLIQFNTVQDTIHPTQKPVPLFEYLIKTYTDEDELVVDICAGSGTAAIACINTNRRFICFENAPKYYAIARERIQKEKAVLTQPF
jgi:site-specific DNA-methyltransferase (adenine-specific)